MNDSWCPAADAVLAWLQSHAISEEKQARAKLREAAARCGIEDLSHITPEQEARIKEALPIIEKEWAEAKAQADAAHKARLAQLRAEARAEQDVIAAPYREQRRLARRRTLLAQKGIL